MLQLRQTFTVQERADRRAGDRPRHPGAAGGAGAEPVRRHALRHRPVRHARRPPDGDGRSRTARPRRRRPARPASRRPTPPATSNKLFDAWGIQYDPTKVVGDLTGAWRVRANPGDRVQAVDFVAWFNIRDGISHDDPATADLHPGDRRLGRRDLPKSPTRSIEFTPLLHQQTTSPALIPVAKVKECPTRRRSSPTSSPTGGPRVIAARVRGVLKSAFTGRRRRRPDAGSPTPKRPDNFPAYQGADRWPGQHGGGRRQRHPGRPLLGPGAGFLRPAGRHAVQRQRRRSSPTWSARWPAATR